jgi:hypothetical protein
LLQQQISRFRYYRSAFDLVRGLTSTLQHASGFERQRVLRRFASAYYKRAGEPWRFRLQAEDAPSFLAQAGWTMSSLLTGSDLNNNHLSRTKLTGTLSTRNTSSFVARGEIGLAEPRVRRNANRLPSSPRTHPGVRLRSPLHGFILRSVTSSDCSTC